VKLLSSAKLLIYAAASIGTWPGLKTSARAITAHAFRAILLAIAIVATRAGFLANMATERRSAPSGFSLRPDHYIAARGRHRASNGTQYMSKHLNTKANIDRPDDLYAQIITAHEVKSDEESIMINARLGGLRFQVRCEALLPMRRNVPLFEGSLSKSIL
jgi:hypothetical protein